MTRKDFRSAVLAIVLALLAISAIIAVYNSYSVFSSIGFMISYCIFIFLAVFNAFMIGKNEER